MPAARTGTILATVLGALVSLAACGSSGQGGAAYAPVSVAPSHANFPAHGCAETAMAALGKVLERVYNEGVSSESTVIARRLIARSRTLRAALQSGDRTAAAAAVHDLLSSGHMTNLTVYRGGHELAGSGGAALTPLRGQIADSGGAVLGTYLASVFADQGYNDEAKGLSRGIVSIRSGGRVVGGSSELGSGELGAAGTLTHGGVRYQYVSFPGVAYPSGSIRIYVFRTLQSLRPLCRPTREGTVAATLQRIANLMYEGESGPRALKQVSRVQNDPALLAAVANRDPAATRAAVAALLHEHVVRLRVTASDGTLLDDLGGPYVLAPLYAPLRLHGRTIGEIELSVQDDEGYKRLTQRLAGVNVVMIMGGKIVKNSLGPVSTPIPASGPFRYGGRNFNVFTVNGQAFPSGPLTVRVLVPDPYL